MHWLAGQSLKIALENFFNEIIFSFCKNYFS